MKNKKTFEQSKKEIGGAKDRQNTIWKDIASKCKHKWQPLSFVFETQLLDKDGRVQIRQPDTNNGRVYCVCMKCCGHTYIETAWVGGFLNSPDLIEEDFMDEQE